MEALEEVLESAQVQSGRRAIGGMGRKKIEMKFIENKNRRAVTFSKRKSGLMKKAYELSVLTGANVLLLVQSESKQVYSFATPPLLSVVTSEDGKELIQNSLCDEDLEDSVQPLQSELILERSSLRLLRTTGRAGERDLSSMMFPVHPIGAALHSMPEHHYAHSLPQPPLPSSMPSSLTDSHHHTRSHLQHQHQHHLLQQHQPQLHRPQLTQHSHHHHHHHHHHGLSQRDEERASTSGLM